MIMRPMDINVVFINFQDEDLDIEEIFTRERAIAIAKRYNLSGEIAWCIDYCGMSPEEALYEFDLI